MHHKRSNFFIPCLKSIRFCHFGRNPNQISRNSQVIKPPLKKVGIFWDLDNKPPISVSPFEAAIKLKKAVSSFGIVRYSIAYANRHAFSYVPPEHRKRVNQIEGDVLRLLTPKVGYGLADDLKRAGFWVKAVPNKPQAADDALRGIVELMDRREVQCVVLVSDDFGFSGVLREAKERCIKTVVVGDNNEGALKRIADGSFSWRDIIVGKARAHSGSVVGRWRDRDVLKQLEWNYGVEDEEGDCESVTSDFSEDEESSESVGLDCCDFRGEDSRPWWELESDIDKKTVVVGDNNKGALKRIADGSFSCRDIIVGKARAQSGSVVGRLKDRDVLKQLEWNYSVEDEEGESVTSDFSEDEESSESVGWDWCDFCGRIVDPGGSWSRISTKHRRRLSAQQRGTSGEEHHGAYGEGD